MKLEPNIQSEVSQKEKHEYITLTHIYGIQRDGNDDPIYKTTKETQTFLSKEQTFQLWSKARVG